jgi:hypothetical protein
MQAYASGYALKCLSNSKVQLDIWTVVGLTVAKFKPLIYLVHGFLLSNCPYTQSQSQNYVTTDGQSANLFRCQAHLGPKNWFLLISDSCRCADMGCSLWREGGSVIYNCCLPWPAKSFLRPSPAGPMTIFYSLKFDTIPTWRPRSSYLYSPGTGFPFLRFLQQAGLRWSYLNPPQHVKIIN